jgi:hypothetical protein
MVEDERDDDIYGTVIIELDGNSRSNNYDNFSNAEIDAIERVYDRRPEFVEDIQFAYFVLDNSNLREDRQEDFYDDMEDFLDGDEDVWNDFDMFYEDLYMFLEYTVDLIN